MRTGKAENPLASADITFSLTGGLGWAGAVNATYSPGGCSLYVGGGMGAGLESNVTVGATHTFTGQASSGPTVSLDIGGGIGPAAIGKPHNWNGRNNGSFRRWCMESVFQDAATMGWTFTSN